MTEQDRIGWSLFSLRLGVFTVMLVWTLDKFFNVSHAAGVFEKFYYIPASMAESLMIGIAIAEAVLIILFFAGIKKRITYGLVLLLHAVSTFSSWEIYMNPFASPNILFWAAWPMLAACLALYLMRDMDTKFTA